MDEFAFDLILCVVENEFMMFEERRRYERKSALSACSVGSLTGRWVCSGYITDISEGGAALDVHKECMAKEKLNIYMVDDHKGKETRKTGVVIWSRNRQFPDKGSTIGLQFL